MKKDWIKNNRGAALISIMIAVAFISILASALLYMSYSNYKMKVVNYESKANFYETEHDLTVMSTSIRNNITKSGDPTSKLKELVGYTQLDATTGSGRYDPHKLMAIVYSTYSAANDANPYDDGATVNIDSKRNVVASGDMTVRLSTAITNTSEANYVVEKEGNVDKITLVGVVIEQYDKNGAYINKITTDMIFRVKKTTGNTDAGGVGEFSMLMDSPASCNTTDGTRVEMYGNVFLGPQDSDSSTVGVQYTYLDGTNTVNPGGANSLTLGGDGSFVSYGDYMVVFGNIILKDRAVLQIVGGNLTVYGDIIVSDSAALICTGNLYFPDIVKPGTVDEHYSVVVEDTGNASNVIIKGSTKTVSEENYIKVITELKLHDDSRTNDGLLPNIFSATAMETLSDCASTAPSIDLKTETFDYYGKKYITQVYQQESSMNAGQAGGLLCFLNKPNVTIADSTDSGQNVDTTFISMYNVNFSGQKVLRYSQIGGATFKYMTLKPGASLPNTAYAYNEDYHQLYVEGGKTNSAYADVNGLEVSGFFNENPDLVVNTVLGLSTNNASGDPSVMSAVGYANWTKE